MAGEHSRPAASPAARARAVAGAVGLVALAGFGIDGLVAGNDALLFGVLCIAWSALLVRTLRDKDDRNWWAWAWLGSVLGNAGQFLASLAHRYHWSAGHVHAASVVQDWFIGVDFACLAIFVIQAVRYDLLPWLHRRRLRASG